MNGYEFIKN